MILPKAFAPPAAIALCLFVIFAASCNGQNYRLPAYETAEKFTDEYGAPELMRIDGYSGDCMEPFITADGRYLFFNNSNSNEVQTHIHLARRTGSTTFQHVGIVPGTVSHSKDMAPTIDSSENLYFTTLRSFDKDGQSLYVGKLANQSVAAVKPVPGTISPGTPGWINMDCDISPDGRTLYISRAQFAPGAPAPRQSDLLIARERNGKFEIDTSSNTVLSAINTQALEYAPSISKSGLELFFTRAGELIVGGKNSGATLRIMVAKRSNTQEPFGEPRVIRSIQGFVEAPTLTADLSELFFHKKDDSGRLRIYRALRKK